MRTVHCRFNRGLQRASVVVSSLLGAAFIPMPASASDRLSDGTGHALGFLALAAFVLAYALVIAEERLHLRKSQPVMVAAGIIWALVALANIDSGRAVADAVRHDLLEFSEVFLFVLAAMTYINTMEQIGIFQALRGWLISRRFSLRAVFWITGLLAFFISSVADNLTTALFMSTVVIAVAGANRRFAAVACINVVVAANAGGAFCAFGDITTLMVWQRGVVQFFDFFNLFVPSLVTWAVPALLMSFAAPNVTPQALDVHPDLQSGALGVVALFIATIVIAVAGHQFLHLPPVLGMMSGLGLLKLYGYFLTSRAGLAAVRHPAEGPEEGRLGLVERDTTISNSRRTDFDVFKILERTEWDTLMFFYGIILCVGGLGALGYLAVVSQSMYGGLGPTVANVLVGVLSAVIDNIPLMYAVLTMHPDMSQGQWLLVTLTTGVGGSLLSIGSAAGVAVMGQARGVYTFFAHLRWTWAIALGYAAGIWIHLVLNANRF